MLAPEVENFQTTKEQNCGDAENYDSNINRLQNISISSDERTLEHISEDSVGRNGFAEKVTLCECYQHKKFFKGCKW